MRVAGSSQSKVGRDFIFFHLLTGSRLMVVVDGIGFVAAVYKRRDACTLRVEVLLIIQWKLNRSWLLPPHSVPTGPGFLLANFPFNSNQVFANIIKQTNLHYLCKR
jgi:hypothetical protein